MAHDDPIRTGLAGGWRHIDASTLAGDLTLEADVVVVGSGSGGATAAETLAAAGLEVVVVEEGPLLSSSDFTLHESQAYPELYQESGARQTADKGITILQGRAAGGSSLVNWTAAFRAPRETLIHWRDVHGLEGLDEATLAPWFDQYEQRLGVHTPAPNDNRNNALLLRGLQRLGWSHGRIQRNVTGCARLGVCGLGCPINAKRSALVTSLAGALERGATLLTRTRGETFHIRQGRIDALDCAALNARGNAPGPHRIRLRARHFVLAGGGINSPALLLRSGAPDPYGRLGRRTFLHPTVVVASLMAKPVHAYSGPPQTIFSNHFNWRHGAGGPAQFKIETAPIYPLLTATVLQGFGAAHRTLMARFSDMHATIALQRDGFNARSPGGRVRLLRDGSPRLDYPLGAYHAQGFRRAMLAMTELHFAAGGKAVLPMHEDATAYRSWREARAAIAALDGLPPRTHVVSAHVMGGCAMGRDEREGVVDASGRHWQLANLTVCDGSLFPTSLGTNPNLAITALAAKIADRLASELAA